MKKEDLGRLVIETTKEITKGVACTAGSIAALVVGVPLAGAAVVHAVPTYSRMANEDSGVDAASLLLFPFYVAIPMAYLGFAGECDIPEILAFPVATNCCSLIYEGVRKARKNLKNNQE